MDGISELLEAMVSIASTPCSLDICQRCVYCINFLLCHFAHLIQTWVLANVTLSKAMAQVYSLLATTLSLLPKSKLSQRFTKVIALPGVTLISCIFLQASMQTKANLREAKAMLFLQHF